MKLHVIHITDTHLFADESGQIYGYATEPGFRAVLERVRQSVRRPDLIIASGDLVHDESLEGYRKWRNALAGFKVPVLGIPGNHDNATVMQDVMAAEPVCFRSSHELGNWRFLLCNTQVPGQVKGRIGAAQLAMIDHALQAEPEANFVIVLHHHPVPVGCRWLDEIGVEDGVAFCELISHHAAVKAVVWGHVHQPWDEQRGAARFLATPSTCIQFLPRSDTFALDTSYGPAWRELTLFDDGRVATRLHRLPAPL